MAGATLIMRNLPGSAYCGASFSYIVFVGLKISLHGVRRWQRNTLGSLFACGAGALAGWKLEVLWRIAVFGPVEFESHEPFTCITVVSSGIGLSLAEYIRGLNERRRNASKPFRPQRSNQAMRALRSFLLLAFSIKDLKAFILYSSCSSTYESVDWTGSKRAVVNQVVMTLRDHGAICAQLFDELAEERGHRIDEIRALKAMWAMSMERPTGGASRDDVE